MYDRTGYHIRNEQTVDGLDRWGKAGVPAGGFGTAVLRNDLRAACDAADCQNADDLYEIVRYCVNQLPRECWGSPEAVAAWPAIIKRDTGAGGGGS